MFMVIVIILQYDYIAVKFSVRRSIMIVIIFFQCTASNHRKSPGQDQAAEGEVTGPRSRGQLCQR